MHVKAKSCNAANKRDIFHTERGQLMQTMHCIKCIVSCYIRMCTYTHTYICTSIRHYILFFRITSFTVSVLFFSHPICVLCC